MSFCDVEKLQIIKKELDKEPAWNKLTEREQMDLKMAILEGLHGIERKAFEYQRL